MYYSCGDCTNVPIADGAYYNYFASKNGWIITIIAISCGDNTTYVGINDFNGNNWTFRGWTEIAIQNEIYTCSDISITEYPNRTGIFRVGELAYGLPSSTNGYGTLMIYGGGYFTHIFRDVSNILWYGTSTDEIVAPTNWRCLLTSDDFTVSDSVLTLNWL